MTTALTTTAGNEITLEKMWNHEQIEALRNVICKDLNDSELKLFAQVCSHTGLNPFIRQIYAVKAGGRLATITGIDGYRILAQRSGEYEGQTEPKWCGEDGIWKDVWLSKKAPAAAKIGVYRKGFREPVWGVALYVEYARGQMWQKMPALMIAKVAESIALRKAFGEYLSGIYTKEEMDQAIDQPQPQPQLETAEVIPEVIPEVVPERKQTLKEKQGQVFGMLMNLAKQGKDFGYEVPDAFKALYAHLKIEGKQTIQKMDSTDLDGMILVLKKLRENLSECFV